MAAIKPPMYSVGFVPVLVGAAAAHMEAATLPWTRVGGLLLGAICIIAWLNLSNDGFDATTGVDRTKPESVVNLTGSRGAVLLAAHTFLAAGLALLGTSLAPAAGTPAAGMLAAAIVCGYVYQGPPFRLSYKGLGEPLCFCAFGPLATPAFYLALSQPPVAAAAAAAGTATATAAGAASGPFGATAARLLALAPPHVWAASVLVGITTTVILFCSHFHQVEGDRAAGKMSPLVRLGTTRGCEALTLATAAAYVLALAAACAAALPPPVAAATALSLPAAWRLLAFAQANHTVAARIAPLKRFATAWHIAFGLSLVLGYSAVRFL